MQIMSQQVPLAGRLGGNWYRRSRRLHSREPEEAISTLNLITTLTLPLVATLKTEELNIWN